MAFVKHARAMVVRPNVNVPTGLVRTASTDRNLVEQAREILGGALDPSQYLITHCTIVASVDVKPVPGIKTGTLKVGSKTINRKWAEYLITPETDQYINNNQDCFSREVLLKSYRTFIGGHNFQEHVQIEEQSKGRIIDAVARDIGDSIYVDILVATDRKNAQLVRDIESGELSTLSMGCVCDSTQCTKCGNVAVDESELCDCIKYAKGNYFFDDQGIKRRIAELCGHPTMNETGGVRYIEASWVRVPAFTGAVLRNIITPSSVVAQSDSIRKILASPPTQWSNADSLKVASVHIKNAEEELDFGAAEDSPSEGEGDKAPAEDKDPLKDAEDNLYKNLKDRVVSRIEKELKDKGPAPAVLPEGSMSTNENISRMAYQKVVVGLTKVASSNKNLLQNLAIVNSAFGISVNPDIYKMAYNVGSRCKYADDSEYLKACIKTAGRPLTQAEARTLIRIGSLLSKKEHGSK
jgi:hypothetical protein